MLKALTERELEVVRLTMAATFEHFSFDFEARLAVTEEEMRSLLESWPEIDDSDDKGTACTAINNALNDLLHGVGISEEEAVETTGVGREEMSRIYRKWAAARGWRSTGVR